MRSGLKKWEELGQEKEPGPGKGQESGVKEKPGEVGTGEKRGIERELEVVRICPNPRLVMCEYRELAEVRRCVVDVGKNAKWSKGMKFRIEEPFLQEEYIRPWVYRGKSPRLKGRW